LKNLFFSRKANLMFLGVLLSKWFYLSFVCFFIVNINCWTLFTVCKSKNGKDYSVFIASVQKKMLILLKFKLFHSELQTFLTAVYSWLCIPRWRTGWSTLGLRRRISLSAAHDRSMNVQSSTSVTSILTKDCWLHSQSLKRDSERSEWCLWLFFVTFCLFILFTVQQLIFSVFMIWSVCSIWSGPVERFVAWLCDCLNMFLQNRWMDRAGYLWN